jgi:hypothetical protein
MKLTHRALSPRRVSCVLVSSYIRMMKDWMKKKQASKFASPYVTLTRGSFACSRTHHTSQPHRVAVVIPFPLLYSPFLPHTFFLPPCYDVFPAVQLPTVPESPHG